MVEGKQVDGIICCGIIWCRQLY